MFEILGLDGQKTLSGTIRINGAKNAALKAMAASVLFDGPVTLHNVPDTDDIRTLATILEKLGAKIGFSRNHTFVVTIDPTGIRSTDIDRELASSMRASVVLTGPLLARFGKVTFPAPGGCVIGARPIDLFLNGYGKLGAASSESDCIYDIRAKGGLVGATIEFPKISVTATETLMMAATIAKGKTTLKNCALEPEIPDVAAWLNACGAKITGAGTPTIEIIGTGGKLLKPVQEYEAMPDRVEAGSYLILGALCAKELTIENCRPDNLELLIVPMKKSGVPIEVVDESTVKISGNTQPNSSFKSFDVETREYPGFMTDLQAPIVTFLTQATGKSRVKENIFEGRFKYVEGLKKMGADISLISTNEIAISGPTSLHELPADQELKAHDIRAGFAIVLAALVGKGTFKVNNIHLIDRGYERLEERLSKLGACIKRIKQ